MNAYRTSSAGGQMYLQCPVQSELRTEIIDMLLDSLNRDMQVKQLISKFKYISKLVMRTGRSNSGLFFYVFAKGLKLLCLLSQIKVNALRLTLICNVNMQIVGYVMSKALAFMLKTGILNVRDKQIELTFL